jgi:tetratricopeptide (TPR) repeat protein
MRWRTVVAVTALLLPVATLADAPQVSEVTAKTVVLDFSSGNELRPGMAGTLCGVEMVGGEPLEVCPARFEVESVAGSRAIAKITKGDAASVQVGFEARTERATVLVLRSNVTGDLVFVDGEAYGPTPQTIELVPGVGHLVRVEKPGSEYQPWQEQLKLADGETREVWAQLKPPKAPPSAEDLLAEANRLYDATLFDQALKAFQLLLETYPNHPDAEYARRLVTACRKRIGSENGFATELVDRARRLFEIEELEEARRLAEEALEIEPNHAGALEILGAIKRIEAPEPKPAPLKLHFFADTGDKSGIQITDVKYELFSIDSGEMVAIGAIANPGAGDWVDHVTVEAPEKGQYRLVVSFRSGQQHRGDWLWDKAHDSYNAAAHEVDEIVTIPEDGKDTTVRITAEKKKMSGLAGLRWVPLRTTITFSED